MSYVSRDTYSVVQLGLDRLFIVINDTFSTLREIKNQVRRFLRLYIL